jgi:hypothetical protein
LLAVGAGLLGTTISFFWGSLHVLFGNPFVGWVWIGVGFLYVLNVCLYHWHVIDFDTARIIGTLLALLVPFWQTVYMGGMIASSKVILWMVLAPLMNLILAKPQRVLSWIVAYFTLLTVSVLIQPYLRSANPLPSNVIMSLFLINWIAQGSTGSHAARSASIAAIVMPTIFGGAACSRFRCIPTSRTTFSVEAFYPFPQSTDMG